MNGLLDNQISLLTERRNALIMGAVCWRSRSLYGAQGREFKVSQPTGHPASFVRHVRIRDFRSIRACDVRLGKLSVLLGFNAEFEAWLLAAAPSLRGVRGCPKILRRTATRRGRATARAGSALAVPTGAVISRPLTRRRSPRSLTCEWPARTRPPSTIEQGAGQQGCAGRAPQRREGSRRTHPPARSRRPSRTPSSSTTPTVTRKTHSSLGRFRNIMIERAEADTKYPAGLPHGSRPTRGYQEDP